jgi:predicted metalloprotease
VADADEWRAAVEAQWRCVHAAWRPVLAEFRLSTLEPVVHFFTGEGADSDCGHVDAPAFYCAVGSGSVYFGDGHLAQARAWDLAVNEMVNHEYGHHLQALFGITANRLVAPGGLQLERRSEFQAMCWSAAMTRGNDAVAFGQAAYDGWVARLDRMREDASHGTRASLRYWGTRGLYAETMGDCNTWVVGAAHVR